MSDAKNNNVPDELKDLKIVYEALTAKQSRHNELWNYYDGKHRMKWTNEKLQEIFRNENLVACENWCSVIVDAPNDRIQLERMDVPDNEQASTRLTEIITETQLDLDQDSVHLDAILTGEAYVIAWKREDGTIEAYYNDARNVTAVYEADRPDMMRVAGKWWVDDAKRRRITLYYPDKIEYWRSTNEVQNQSCTFSAGHWQRFTDDEADGIGENPFGQIPVFHFRSDRRSTSCLQNAISLQDTVNKTLADMMVCSEFGAYPQRWMIAHVDGEGQLPYGPGRTLALPPADKDTQPVSVGTFEAANLANFTGVIDNLAQAMAVISRTPKHYFWAQGGVPSGEALIAMEAPLNKRVERYIKRFRAIWDRLGRFLLVLDGLGDVEKVESVFADHRTVQPIMEATIRKTNVDAGVPLRTQLRDEGWSEDQLDQMEADKADQNNPGIPPTLPQDERETRIATQAKAFEPSVQELVQALGDAVTDYLTSTGAIDRIVKAKAAANAN
jgi:hypothetical protein